MKVLITGISGFIGSHLAEYLLKNNCSVVGIDNFNDYYDPNLKRLNAKIVSDQGGVVHEGDLLKLNLEDLIQDVEVIFHLAAQPGNSSSVSLERYVTNNIFVTDRLLHVAEKSNSLKYFINIATSSVYGKYATKSESQLTEPISNYGVTKLAAEQLVLAKYREKNFDACSMRLFSVFGPRERTDKLFPKLFSSALTGELFPLFDGSLEHLRSYTYISDAIQGLISPLNSWSKAKGEIFNIGSADCVSTQTAVNYVEQVTGKEIKFNKLPKRPGDQLSTHAEISKATELLGYQPKITIKEGVSLMHEYLLSNC